MTTAQYSLLDFGQMTRLEQWGAYRLIRPDPTAVLPRAHPELWTSADAEYTGKKGEGAWQTFTTMPTEWLTAFGDIELVTKLAPYKHTGIFPEQFENWQVARHIGVLAKKPLKILHLFGYTGGATVSLAKDGHFVTHVDASKPAIEWAKKNAAQNAIASTGIRWIHDDIRVFTEREIKRGNTYDAIILDPPAYGHGKNSQTWRIERDLDPLLHNCFRLLSATPAFVFLNGYAHNDTPAYFKSLLLGKCSMYLPNTTVRIQAKELTLSTNSHRHLSTGIVVRAIFL